MDKKANASNIHYFLTGSTIMLCTVLKTAWIGTTLIAILRVSANGSMANITINQQWRC